MVPIEVVMKPAFNLETWWWGNGETPKGNILPRWWINFVNEYPDSKDWYRVLKKSATYRIKNNGMIRLVFNSPDELSFFILRWS